MRWPYFNRSFKIPRHYFQAISFTNELTVVVSTTGPALRKAKRQIRRLAQQGVIQWKQTIRLPHPNLFQPTTDLDNPLLLLVVPKRWSASQQAQQVQGYLASLLKATTPVKLVCPLPLDLPLMQQRQLSCWLAVDVQATTWLSTYLYSPRRVLLTRTADGRIDHASYQRLWRADVFSSER
ncbi:hypothetical protein [Loigolactobacillus binensis]|uniref:Uncharacterized protein n=1 Tax=Loigolactobacillus binensis TaxID=2559922 RepID=A0ABW3EG07_9LACO|nr:hypothetical protein [Loigolactobacillus binensis]